MTPRTITLTALPDILLVTLPEGAKLYGLWTIEPNRLTYADPHGHDTSIMLPQGNWRIVSTLADLTEEQVVNLVEPELEEIDGKMHHIGWKDYETDCMYIETALGSLESAILAEGYYLDENPFGKAPGCGCTGPSDKGSCDGCDEYMEAQSRTLDPELTLILERK